MVNRIKSFQKAWMFQWILHALLAILSVEGRAINPIGRSTAWMVPTRGGDDSTVSDGGTSTVHSVVAVLQLGEDHDDAMAPLWLVGNDSTRYSAVFQGSQSPHPIYRIPKLPPDDNLVRSLGWLSDVIILWLPSNTNPHHLKTISQTLSELAQERLARTITPRPRLVVVSDAAKDSWWVQDLVQNSLQSIVPSFWESFDILTPQQLETQWKNGDYFQPPTGIIKSLLLPYPDNASAACQLLKQLYMSMTDKTSTVDLKEGWFELQAVPLESIMDQAVIDNEVGSSLPPSGDDNDQDPQDRIQRVLAIAQQDLTTLEAKLQQVQLETSSSNSMPLLDFGTQANAILDRAWTELESFLPYTMRINLLSRLVLEVYQLYKEQLQALRDYYGRRYEMILDQHKEEDEAVWVKEAEHLTQGFQAASQHAIPRLCQKDGPLATIVTFDAMPCLQGLIQDMLEATQLRKDEHSLAFDEEDDDDEYLLQSEKKPRVPRWVKKLASRAITLGINYLQGWLAWQGVKRAALERDREMPKFPLF